MDLSQVDPGRLLERIIGEQDESDKWKAAGGWLKCRDGSYRRSSSSVPICSGEGFSGRRGDGFEVLPALVGLGVLGFELG